MADRRERYRIQDFERPVEKLRARNIDQVREADSGLIEGRIEGERFAWKPGRNEPVAVGSESFVGEPTSPGLRRSGVTGEMGQAIRPNMCPFDRSEQ